MGWGAGGKVVSIVRTPLTLAIHTKQMTCTLFSFFCLFGVVAPGKLLPGPKEALADPPPNPISAGVYSCELSPWVQFNNTQHVLLCVVTATTCKFEKVFKCRRPSSNQLTLDEVLCFSSTAQLSYIQATKQPAAILD